MRKTFPRDFRKRRSGVALVVALVVVLLGSSLMLLLFEMTTQFASMGGQLYRPIYNDQVNVTGYIQEAKGAISMLNAENTPPAALHAWTSADWGGPNMIRNLEDLQLTANPLLSRDVIASDGRRVVVRVFDLFYRQEMLDASISAAELARMPAPLTVINPDAAAPEEVVNEGFVEEVDVKIVENQVLPSTLNIDQIGVYLVRVELYRDRHSVFPIRTAEEAFYQIYP